MLVRCVVFPLPQRSTASPSARLQARAFMAARDRLFVVTEDAKHASKLAAIYTAWRLNNTGIKSRKARPLPSDAAALFPHESSPLAIAFAEALFPVLLIAHLASPLPSFPGKHVAEDCYFRESLVLCLAECWFDWVRNQVPDCGYGFLNTIIESPHCFFAVTRAVKPAYLVGFTSPEQII